MGVKVREKVKGSGEWWLFIEHQNMRRSKKVGRDKRKAIEAAKIIQAKLALKDFGVLEEKPAIRTFAEYANSWITITVPATCKESTQNDYKGILKNHVIPVFGYMPIDQIKRSDVKTFLMGKYTSGLARSTVGHIKSAISGVFNHAVEDETIIANPAQRIGKLFRKDEVQNECDPLSRSELSHLLKCIRAQYPDFFPFFLLLSRTGMRIGEGIALKWEDINFEQRMITVRRSINNYNKVDTPKSAKSRRVDMSLQLKGELQRLQHQRKLEKIKNGWGTIPEWVFVNSEGKPLDKNNVRNRVFYKALERAGLRKVRIHDLRHTYASLLIQAAESLAYIRDQMGHHSINVTVDIYGHLVPGGNKEAVDGLDDTIEDAPIRTLSAP